ncbi:MAG TPA: hypothetical protein VFJ06_06750 [Halococcus sp.]|nr:hypothetical protein [Halococcus sp.]
MATADDLRRERNPEKRDRERYACADCGSVVLTDEQCVECGGTNIVTVEEIIDPHFRE